jgi:hypothetical protein
MFQQSEDYIIRVLIPTLVAMLTELLSLKRLQHYEEASEVIAQNTEKLLGMKLDVLLRVPDPVLLAMLRDDTIEGRVRCLALAEILKETAELGRAQETDEYTCFLKAFNIFYEILLVKDTRGLKTLFNPEQFADREASFAQVVEALRGYTLPEEVMLKAMHYYEHVGAFADAEDVFFEALDTSDNEADLLERGIEFFKRLRIKSDDALNAGNLSREEVESGLQELQERAEELER